MLAKSGQKTALAGDWPKAIASQGWLNEGRRRGDIASASPAPMTDIANILRRNGQFSSVTSLHSVKQAPACWGLRPQSPKREASADKATAAPHVAAALCQAQGWLPRISPILNVPSPADWRNLDATAVLIARPSPKLPRGPETLHPPRCWGRTSALSSRCFRASPTAAYPTPSSDHRYSLYGPFAGLATKCCTIRRFAVCLQSTSAHHPAATPRCNCGNACARCLASSCGSERSRQGSLCPQLPLLLFLRRRTAHKSSLAMLPSACGLPCPKTILSSRSGTAN